jgi:predicted dehydrogenase
MAPIRVGLAGLSAKGSWAKRAHLPYLKNSPDYTIVALANSTIEAGRAAVEAFGLDDSTKSYDNPTELAEDPNVDLVVVATRVDRHRPYALAALHAGKDVFIEWPLGKNMDETHEIASLARAKGVRTMVGLQSRGLPALQKVKELIAQGMVGTVLSTSMSHTESFLTSSMPESMAYINQDEVGGTLHTIMGGHGV